MTTTITIPEAKKILRRRGWLASAANPCAVVVQGTRTAWLVADDSASVEIKRPVTRRKFLAAIRRWYDELAEEREWPIRDPFVGARVVVGETLEEAIDDAYQDLDPAERPEYVWYEGQRVAVAGGRCRPTQ